MLRRALIVFLPFVFAVVVSAQDKPIRPVHTFSIVAFDPATGQMGVAVQSHWFAVGGKCPLRKQA